MVVDALRIAKIVPTYPAIAGPSQSRTPDTSRFTIVSPSGASGWAGVALTLIRVDIHLRRRQIGVVGHQLDPLRTLVYGNVFRPDDRNPDR